MKFWTVMIWIVIIGISVIILGGCLSSYTSPIPPVVDATPQQALIKIVTQTNWFVTLGIVLCIIGVMTGINGSTKFMAWIGGGLASIALAGLVAAFFAVLAAYTVWIMLFFGVLIVIGFIAFFHTAADFNQDGHIDWNDVKAVFKWKGKLK